jgi:hypothetical protein
MTCLGGQCTEYPFALATGLAATLADQPADIGRRLARGGGPARRSGRESVPSYRGQVRRDEDAWLPEL